MRRLAIAVVAPLVLVLAGCGADTSTSTATEQTTSSPSDPAASSETSSEQPAEDAGASAEDADSTQDGDAVPALLDFAGRTVDGGSFDGASLAGSPTVLWFWAPWCPTCRGQIPQVEALADDFGDRVDVVGIGSLDSAEAIADFAGDVDGVTQLEDADGELWKRFGVTEQSSFVVLDADGEVAFEAGYGGSDDLADRVESLLG